MLDYLLEPYVKEVVEINCPCCNEFIKLECSQFYCEDCDETFELPEPEYYEDEGREYDVIGY